MPHLGAADTVADPPLVPPSPWPRNIARSTPPPFRTPQDLSSAPPDAKRPLPRRRRKGLLNSAPGYAVHPRTADRCDGQPPPEAGHLKEFFVQATHLYPPSRPKDVYEAHVSGTNLRFTDIVFRVYR